MIETAHDSIRSILQPLLIYCGAVYTVTANWISQQGIDQTQDIITIMVGLATLVYTVTKIAEARQRMKIAKEEAYYEQRERQKKVQ